MEKHHHITHGRMNPPTVGHETVVNQVKSHADKTKGGHTIILTHSHDSKKNPLSPEQKVKHAKRAFPGANVKTSSKAAPTILHHASELHKKGVTHLHVHVGSDRVKQFHTLLHKYNGQKSAHGHYDFKKIKVHAVGAKRDDSGKGVSGASGTAMRKHAASGNSEAFHKMAPSKMSKAHKDELYHDVRGNLKEGFVGFADFCKV